MTLAGLVLGTACRNRPPAADTAMAGRVTVVTREEIVAMRAATAWDVVVARAPRLRTTGEPGRPNDLRIQETRSINADEAPLLVVDGAQGFDLTWLTQLPASEVAFIRILSAEAAEPLYGLRAAGGAIEVVTRMR